MRRRRLGTFPEKGNTAVRKRGHRNGMLRPVLRIGLSVRPRMWSSVFQRGHPRSLHRMPGVSEGSISGTGASGAFRVRNGNHTAVLFLAPFGGPHRVNLMSWCVLSGHHGGPTWGTVGGICVGLRKNDPLVCKLVYVWCFVVATTVESNIRPP